MYIELKNLLLEIKNSNFMDLPKSRTCFSDGDAWSFLVLDIKMQLFLHSLLLDVTLMMPF